MKIEEIRSFYEKLDFDMVEIDDEDVLFLEIPDRNIYATVTDIDGAIPLALEDPIIWSVYDENDAFQWSVTVENSHYLEGLFSDSDSYDDILQSLRSLREDNIQKADPSHL